jgi:hypothetical protein
VTQKKMTQKNNKNKKMTDDERALRQQVLDLLAGGGAHAGFDDAISGLPAKLRGRKPRGLPHTAWMLVEHMRIAQRDILEFSRNPNYVCPHWPDDYWPPQQAPPSPAAWAASIQKFRQDLKTMQALVKNPKTDLFAKLSWGEGQTILREALLVADHNAYHLAQLVDLRRLLGAWPG